MFIADLVACLLIMSSLLTMVEDDLVAQIWRHGARYVHWWLGVLLGG